MELSQATKTAVKEKIKKEVTAEIKLEREMEKSCEKYHQWYKSSLARGEKPLSIIAEGDSWYRYIVGKGVIHYLENLLRLNILNLAYPGDEVKDMLTLKQKKRLIKELKKGPAPRRKYDYFLFSGGGNDLVGADRFHKCLHDYETGMTAEEVLNRDTLVIAFDNLRLGYEELISIRDENSPNTKLICHAYDFAIPDGRRVCGRGPWLKPGLDFRKVPKILRRDVVKLFLVEFEKLLKKIARSHDNITVVNTQGTLEDNEWANELHPTNPGFKKIAQVFVPEIS